MKPAKKKSSEQSKSSPIKTGRKKLASDVLVTEVNVTDDYPFYKDYNSEYVELSKNRILEVQAKRLTIYSKKGDKYAVDSNLAVDLLKVGQTTNLSSWENDVVLLFSAQALYVIDASGKTPMKPERIPLKSKWEHVSILTMTKSTSLVVQSNVAYTV
jgi:hypothetical protein